MSSAPSTASAIASVDALNRPPGFVNLHPDVSINYQLNRWLSAMTPQALTDVAEHHDQFPTVGGGVGRSGLEAAGWLGGQAA